MLIKQIKNRETRAFGSLRDQTMNSRFPCNPKSQILEEDNHMIKQQKLTNSSYNHDSQYKY